MVKFFALTLARFKMFWFGVLGFVCLGFFEKNALNLLVLRISVLFISLDYWSLFTQRPQTYILKRGLCCEYTITTVSIISQVLPGHKRDSSCFGDK